MKYLYQVWDKSNNCAYGNLHSTPSPCKGEITRKREQYKHSVAYWKQYNKPILPSNEFCIRVFKLEVDHDEEYIKER